MLDTQPKIILAEAPAPAPSQSADEVRTKPRVRFRDYRCTHCGRLLMRASLDTIALALPQDFKDTHPLLLAALKAVVCEIRCPKCGCTNSYAPMADEAAK
jgi:phage FluMu protein Com